MKKILLSTLLIAASLSPASIPSSHAQSPLICLAYDVGGPGDSSFNDAAQSGLRVAASELEFTL
jgi:basic membrane lipoprotein Med (substrate-binding protein (PBP1-ABC) superfamily)